MKRLNITLLLTMLISMVGTKALAYTLYNVNGIYYAFWGTNATVTSSSTDTASVVIPETVTYNGTTYSVTSIDDGAFRDCSSLRSVSIPNSVTSIGGSAFRNCSGLTNVTIPNSVTSIGGGAFEGTAWYINQADGLVYAGKVAYKYKGAMPSNTSIILKEGTLGIASSAFSGCSGLTSITIPNSVTSIGYGAFEGTAWYNNQADGLVYAGKVAYKYKGAMPSNTSIILKEGTLGIAAYAFWYSGLTSVTIPNSVTSIGSSAFRDCSGLTSVTIPNSVTSIGDDAFFGCSGLTSVTIPNSVIDIGEYAFYGCSSLKSMTIPNSVTRIGYCAFSNCSALESVTIGNSVTDIGEGAFSGCSGLTSVTFPSSVTSIGGGAFSGCSGLTSVTIPNSVTSIDGGAFSGCSGLTSVTIGNSVTNIGTYAFENCSGLTEVNYNATNCTSMGSPFSNCPSLTTINIGKNVQNIPIYAFYGCSGKLTINCNIPNANSSSFSGSNFSEVSFSDDVTTIGSNAFSNCSGLTSVTIGNSVTDIGDCAFSNCSGLTSVAIPNSVTSIGDYAFSNCSGLSSVTIPNSVTSIGKGAFSGCSGLTSATIGNSVMSIGNSAFSNCSGLTSVTIPNSVTSIGDWAFYNCSGLTEVNYNATNCTSMGNYYCTSMGNYFYPVFSNCSSLTTINIGDNVQNIPGYAFYGCSGLKSVTIPNSVTSIGNDAFSRCKIKVVNVQVTDFSDFCNNMIINWISDNIGKPVRLIDKDSNEIQEFAIPEGVLSIGERAFFGCSGLTSVTIPNSVTIIGYEAFYNCSSLTSVTIPNSVTSIGGRAFYGCSGKLTINCNIPDAKMSDESPFGNSKFSEVRFSNDVSTIGRYAFYGCSSLTSVTIPNSVTSIGGYAFYGCSGLTSVTIPNSVTSIGDKAFYYCTKLSTVTVKMKEPVTISDYTFYGCKRDTLYVPYGSKAAYEAAAYWKTFKEIVELEPEDEQGTDIATLDNVIYIDDVEVRIGEDVALSVKMKNTAAIRGFQFDLYLPEGVTVVKSAKGKIQGSLSAGRLPDEDEHTLTFSEQPDGAVRFLCSSQYDETFTGNDGEIATLLVNIADDMAEGDYPIQLKAMKLTETDISKFYETALVQSKLTVVSYVIGDINGDKVVDVSDYTGVANHIHGNTPVGFYAKAADVDKSGAIDVSDYTGIANIIHTGSIYGNSNHAPAKRLSPRRVNTDLSDYDNVIYISPFVAEIGSQAELSISMKNTAEIRGFQFDLYLPEGMTVAKSSKGRIQGSLSADRLPDEDEHELTFSEQPDGAVRFLCGSQYDETFTGNSGEIATLRVNVDESVAEGDYPILLKAMKLTESDIRNFYTADEIATTVTLCYDPTTRIYGFASGGSSKDAEVYDLTGRKVAKVTKNGVYIVSGQKLLKR